MKKNITILLVCIFYVLSCSSTVFSITNIEMLSNCTNDESAFKKGICFGFIESVLDSYYVIQHLNKIPIMICETGESNYGEYVDIYIDYVTKRPEELHNSSITSYLFSMIEAYPCNK